MHMVISIQTADNRKHTICLSTKDGCSRLTFTTVIVRNRLKLKLVKIRFKMHRIFEILFFFIE